MAKCRKLAAESRGSMPMNRNPEVFDRLRQQIAEKKSITEAAREELLYTLNDLIERYEYETVRDVMWTLKPDVSGKFWCGDCRRYVDAPVHGCTARES